METQDPKDHTDRTLERFTQTAVSFGEVAAHTSRESLRHLIHAAGVSENDTVLDVACGPGIVACAFAEVAQQVTGIDLTPAMIEQAQARQKQKGLTNTTWSVANLPPLPYPDAGFSRVVTRYSFHHFLDPKKILSEMVRVCKPGGQVVVADVYAPENVEQAAAYNHLEKLRDSSHTWIQSVSALSQMVQDSGLRNIRTSYYRIQMEMEDQLRASCTPKEEADQFRRLLRADLEKNTMGTDPFKTGDQIHFHYPIVVMVGEKS